MLGFILSKLNLLILVTAIFAIVGFFALGLTDITKVNEANELASRLSEKSFALANSASYCISDSYLLPNELLVAGNDYYYVLAVSEAVIELEGGKSVNTLIFSVYPRDEIKKSYAVSDYEPKAIAAKSFRTKADLRLFSADYADGAYSGSVSEQGPIYVDPQAQNPANYLLFIKEVINNEATLYVLGCGPGELICETAKTSVGEAIHPPTGTAEGGFKC